QAASVVHPLDYFGRRHPMLRPRSLGHGPGVCPRHRPRRHTPTRNPGIRHGCSLRRTPPQRDRPLLGELCEPIEFPRTLRRVFYVERGAVEPLGVITELPEPPVAVEAQDPAHLTT